MRARPVTSGGQLMRRVSGWLGLVLAGAAVLSMAAVRAAEGPVARPRVLALPWLVIDRNSNKDCAKLGPSEERASGEGRLLGESGQASLDTVLHRSGLVELVPRKEWAPEWEQVKPGRVMRQGLGCAVCAPTTQLMRYDRAAVQGLAKAVRADYVWLGVTVVPLTLNTSVRRADECCRNALMLERDAVLARSSAVLVRASDGEVVWQQDARSSDPSRRPGGLDVRFAPPHARRPTPLTPYELRQKAVQTTARALGSAFRRDAEQVLR